MKLVVDPLQHEAGRVAFQDAQKQMEDISQKIETKAANIAKIQSDKEKSKLEASEARKVEQVRGFNMSLNLSFSNI